MSTLTIYRENDPTALEVYNDAPTIAEYLAQAGVLFEVWNADQPIAADANQDDIIAAYRDSVARLMKQYDFQSVDVIRLKPDHPDKAALRAKFLNEHTHSDYEVRFFVAGEGLFYIHTHGKVYAALCQAGDLISVPANTPHWFDMGPNPDFTCIRLFTNPDGWVARFTGSPIAEQFPRLGE